MTRRSALLETHLAQLAERLKAELTGLSPDERLAAVARVRTEQGYMAEAACRRAGRADRAQLRDSGGGGAVPGDLRGRGESSSPRCWERGRSARAHPEWLRRLRLSREVQGIMSSSVETLVNKEYKYGFVTDIESDVAPKGLTEDTIRFISARKHEPEWLLEWRLKAYRGWTKMTEPHDWPNIRYTPVDYQSISYYSAPKTQKPLGSLDEVDPKLLETYEKLGIPLSEQKLLAGCRGRRDLRQRLRRHHVQGQARRAGDHLLLLRRGGAGASRAGQEVSGLGRPGQRQLLRGAQRGGLQRRLLRVRPEGRPLSHGAVHLLPDQHGADRAVRAHPHRRRRGGVRELPRGLHGPEAGRESAPRGGGGARGARRAPRSSTRRCRTGMRATRRGGAASTTSSPSGASAPARGPRSRGPRSRPARPSPGSIPA